LHAILKLRPQIEATRAAAVIKSEHVALACPDHFISQQVVSPIPRRAATGKHAFQIDVAGIGYDHASITPIVCHGRPNSSR
jgi:hypothetical protein